MTQCERESTLVPRFSIVIPAYNDWIPLKQCLQSLAQQTNAPEFEVIIVDDGSTEAAPEYLRSAAPDHPFTVIQQTHAGIPAARNRGIRAAKGEVLLFVDADCRLQAGCLTALSSVIADAPQHDCFQLRLVGNCSTVVGRAEHLRLLSFQSYMLKPDGGIRYLNTAGFAIRRERVDVEAGVFDPAALRAEDTLLLAHLIQEEKLPLFVPNAVVEHAIPLSLMQCVQKDIQSVSLQHKGVRHHRLQRGKDPNHESGTLELATVDVERGRPEIHRTIRLVCACSQAISATDDLFNLPLSADSACHAGVTLPAYW